MYLAVAKYGAQEHGQELALNLGLMYDKPRNSSRTSFGISLKIEDSRCNYIFSYFFTTSVFESYLLLLYFQAHLRHVLYLLRTFLVLDGCLRVTFRKYHVHIQMRAFRCLLHLRHNVLVLYLLRTVSFRLMSSCNLQEISCPYLDVRISL